MMTYLNLRIGDEDSQKVLTPRRLLEDHNKTRSHRAKTSLILNKHVDFGVFLMMQNNKEVDYPSVGHDSSPKENTIIKVKQRNTVNAMKERDPPKLLSEMQFPAPRKESQKELSAFSNALQLYKAKKNAFKLAEKNLFSLFKSNKESKKKNFRKNTSEIRDGDS